MRREKIAMIRQNLRDLVTFDTAPAIEEKGQYPRAINIAVVPSGVAAMLKPERQTQPKALTTDDRQRPRKISQSA
jgi:hypothetical protein